MCSSETTFLFMVTAKKVKRRVVWYRRRAELRQKRIRGLPLIHPVGFNPNKLVHTRSAYVRIVTNVTVAALQSFVSRCGFQDVNRLRRRGGRMGLVESRDQTTVTSRCTRVWYCVFVTQDVCKCSHAFLDRRHQLSSCDIV